MTSRPEHRRWFGVWPSYSLAVALGVGAAACGVELDSPAEVDSLRILGVRKNPPYAAPGEDVELSMLWYDGTLDDGQPRQTDVERVWIGGCTNPPGDFYYGCAPNVLFTLAALRAAQEGFSEQELMDVAAQFADVKSESELVDALRSLPFDFEGPLLEPGVPTEPLAFGQFGVGDRFTLSVPTDVIARFPENREPYGVMFPFFAACAGTLYVSLDVLDQVVPLECRDEYDKVLGSDDFVLGYASVYAYENLQNSNPTITGFEVGDVTLDASSPFLCIDEDCLVPDEPLAVGEACTRHLECASEYCDGGVCAEAVEPACDEEDVPCIDPCADDGDVTKCDTIPIRPLLDRDQVAEDDPLSSVGGETSEEQIWVNYHVDQGGVANVVRLVNDSTKGWNEDYGTELAAPAGHSVRSSMYVWAVVRDNRGGASWARQKVFVKAEP